MSARLFSVVVLLIAPPALCASPSEGDGEPEADGCIEWVPDPIIEGILKSDLPAAKKVAHLAKFVRV